MNMKRFVFALLAALLLCLMAGSALAVSTVDLTGRDGAGEITINENATITGSATGVYLKVASDVTELTLRDVIITSSDASALTFSGSSGATLTLTLEGNNKLENSNGHGINVGGGLEITGTGSVTATGGAGTGIGWGGTGIYVRGSLEITGTGSVIANGGNGDSFGGMGMDIQFTDGLSISNGSTVTINAGGGPNGLPALQTYGNILVDSATLTVNAPQSDGILLDSKFGSAEKLTVSGDSHVTVDSGSGAAVCFTNDGNKPAQIELNGAFVMRAGENKVSATEIDMYDQMYPYLSIEPVKPIEVPVPDSTNLPQTGDNSNVILWSALACISVIGMMTLVRKRKEA